MMSLNHVNAHPVTNVNAQPVTNSVNRWKNQPRNVYGRHQKGKLIGSPNTNWDNI